MPSDIKDLQKTRDLLRHRRMMRPTLKHRPVLTFGILGTVYGVSPEGEVRYFDYDWNAALEFAGVTGDPAQDLRFSAPVRTHYLPGHDMWHPERCIRQGEKAYWVLKTG
jgi:hypothetical protein